MKKCSYFKMLLLTVGFLWMSGFQPVMAQTWSRSGASSDAVKPELKIEADSEGALYLDFKGATLMNVLKVLSEVTHINFVAGGEIATREVNMSLDGVTLEQALMAIARGVNVTYDYIPDTKIIMFRASADSPTLAPLYTRVFKLYFLRASKIQEIDAGLSSSGGSSGASTTGSQSTSTSGGNNYQSSSGSSQGSSTSGSTAGTDVPIIKIIEKMLSERGTVAVDDRSNSLIATDSEDRLDRIAAVIAELDHPLNQVLISVLLVETFEDLDRELGIEWAQNTGADDGLFGTLNGAGSDSQFPFSNGNKYNPLGSLLKAEPLTTTTSGNAILGSKDFTSLNVKVRALQTASKLHIVAKPNVLVMDNSPAIIKISTNAAIGTTAVTSGDGAAGTTTSTAERAEVGTILRVTPQINTQDQITLTIEPTFATVDTSTITIGTDETGDPTVRTARTTVMVNSGKTLVMGGMLFSTQSDGDRKVPFLGDMPIIGKLFTKEDKAIQDRELVLFLTPQIIKNPAAMDVGNPPGRAERFDDVSAQFWKYKKKTWYKNMAAGGPKPPVDFDSFFKVRQNAMDQMTENLAKEKEMSKMASSAGAPSSLSGDGAKWEVR